jgi:hypothetical protein
MPLTRCTNIADRAPVSTKYLGQAPPCTPVMGCMLTVCRMPTSQPKRLHGLPHITHPDQFRPSKYAQGVGQTFSWMKSPPLCTYECKLGHHLTLMPLMPNLSTTILYYPGQMYPPLCLPLPSLSPSDTHAPGPDPQSRHGSCRSGSLLRTLSISHTSPQAGQCYRRGQLRAAALR